MMSDFEPYIADLLANISADLGDSLDVSSTRWVSRPDGKDKIADSTLALYVDGKGTNDSVVVLISNPEFPHAVGEDIEKARAVAQLAGPEIARHIIKPLTFGVHGTQTYTVFKKLTALSENRVMRSVQKRRASGGVVNWLAKLGAQTRQPRTTPEDIATYFATPLQALCADTGLSEGLRAFGAQCLSGLEGGKQDLFTCVEHGDFWLGNVFFEPGPQYDTFSVIDWRGSRTDGYPCLDLTRYCLSTFKTGSRSTARLFKAYQEVLGLSAYDTGFYAVVALGRLGMNLDKFPKERYCALADRVFGLLSAHGCTTPQH